MVRYTSFGWMAIAAALLMCLVILSNCTNAQEEELLLEPDEIGVEVLLNHPNVTIDLSVMAALIEEDIVRMPGWDPSLDIDISSLDLSLSIFLFRSHLDPDLGVILSKENFTELLWGVDPKPDLEGWALSIVIPGEFVFPDPNNYFDPKVKPDIDKDLSDIDWKMTMKVELEWLISEGVFKGLDESDIQYVMELTELGTMGLKKRIFFYQFTEEWMLYNEAPLPEITLVYAGQGTYPNSMFPDRIAPSPDDDEERISAGLIILISSGFLLFIIGSFFFQRINRAVKLNNARRKMIYERVQQNPGIHFSALMKDLDLKPGVASYHINRLEKMELIKSYQDGMYRRFYLFEDKVETKIMLSDLQKMILITVKDEPGISQVDISRMIGRSKMVINYHVRFLRDLGILIMEREGRKTHCYLTPQGSRFATT
jgi:predicted transcriptional regulator